MTAGQEADGPQLAEIIANYRALGTALRRSRQLQRDMAVLFGALDYDQQLAYIDACEQIDSEDPEQDPDDVFDLAPRLDDTEYLLEQLHATAGWEYGITLTASTHVQWNAEIRVTPAPHSENTSDRSYTVLRVGPPEWALNQALQDVLRWLNEATPPDVPEPCWCCGDDPEGYHGKEQEQETGR